MGSSRVSSIVSADDGSFVGGSATGFSAVPTAACVYVPAMSELGVLAGKGMSLPFPPSYYKNVLHNNVTVHFCTVMAMVQVHIYTDFVDLHSNLLSYCAS